ncbi:protein CFAP141 [Nematostella vectensis]|uniref:protein CFAP141 n=1 Tax=Nematostella vectensis TaxID=45351 RepID=UPI0020779731|nr:protein CFAP141 [Nematostella vectensis]
MDEMISSRERSEQLAQQELERSSWLASLDEKSEKRRTARELVALKEESKHGNREILLLRRSRLRQLINQELQEQEKELNAIGVAFYVKRI